MQLDSRASLTHWALHFGSSESGKISCVWIMSYTRDTGHLPLHINTTDRSALCEDLNFPSSFPNCKTLQFKPRAFPWPSKKVFPNLQRKVWWEVCPWPGAQTGVDFSPVDMFQAVSRLKCLRPRQMTTSDRSSKLKVLLCSWHLCPWSFPDFPVRHL